MLLNNLVTIISSLFIGYYKLNEILEKRKKEKEHNIILENINIENNNMENNIDDDKKKN